MGHLREHLSLFRIFATPNEPPRWHQRGGRRPREARFRWERAEDERIENQHASASAANLSVIAGGFSWANLGKAERGGKKAYKGKRSVMGEKKYTRRARL